MKKVFRKGQCVRLKHIKTGEIAKILSFAGQGTEKCAILDKKLSVSNIWNLDSLEKANRKRRIT